MKNLKEIFLVFFKLGCIGFGGPAAHIAMMQDEIIEKRKWMSKGYFLDLMGATNLIPGPNSTEMTMHCGYERGGVLGLFVAGIFPSAVLTGIFAYLYVAYNHLPAMEAIVFGIKPAVLAIILSAIIKLGKKALKTVELGIIGALVVVFCFLGYHEITVLLGAGVLGTMYFQSKNQWNNNINNFSPLLLALIAKPTSVGIFVQFLKIGAVLYGSGYVLFAYLDAELVDKGYLTHQQLIDAIAVGQFTPGPVLTTATFIGYQLNGIWGAVAATIGIFLPSFLFVFMLKPLIGKMRKSKVLGYFLDSVNIAAVAVMLVVLLEMSLVTLMDWKSIGITLISILLVFGVKKVGSMWIVLLGAVLGYLLQLI